MRISLTISTLFVILCCLALAVETRAQAITSYTSIDYYADIDTLDAYSETDVDWDLAGDYDAYVSLRVLDGNGFIIASGSAHDYYYDGIASVERIVVGTNPDTTYTALGAHKAYLNLWDYYDEYPYYPYYYDNFYFSSFEGQGIWQPWWYYFLSPGFQQIRRSSPSIMLGTTYDEKSVTTPDCVKPVREGTTFAGWADSDGYPTVAKWRQTLFPTSKNFSGREVTETNPGGGSDQCYFTGSEFPQQTHVLGDSWTVGTGNQWGDDANGIPAVWVQYYQTQGRAPCTMTIPQQMVIDCPTGDAVYTTHILRYTIGTATVTSWHNGALADRAWP